MSVYDNLRQILSARYGKDVRQAIHDSIQQCYSDATGNPESVAAFADDILALQNTITSMQTTINGQFNKFFPVGSLYYTGDDTFNPNTAEGWQGTWSKIEGRFILGSSEDYEVNNVGGEATHTLTVNELASHTHEGTTGTGYTNFLRVVGASGTTHEANTLTGYSAASFEDVTESGNFPGANHQHSFTTDSTGGGQPHNNMPPYEVKHIWERTA